MGIFERYFLSAPNNSGWWQTPVGSRGKALGGLHDGVRVPSGDAHLRQIRC